MVTNDAATAAPTMNHADRRARAAPQPSRGELPGCATPLRIQLRREMPPQNGVDRAIVGLIHWRLPPKILLRPRDRSGPRSVSTPDAPASVSYPLLRATDREDRRSAGWKPLRSSGAPRSCATFRPAFAVRPPRGREPRGGRIHSPGCSPSVPRAAPGAFPRRRSPYATALVDRRVADDSGEPRAEPLGVLEGSQGSPGTQESLLDSVARPVAVAADRIGDRQRRTLVAMDQLGKCGRFSTLRFAYQVRDRFVQKESPTLRPGDRRRTTPESNRKVEVSGSKLGVRSRFRIALSQLMDLNSLSLNALRPT